MKVLKRILAVALAVGMTLSLAACSDTSWVYDYNGKKVPSGLYIAYTMNAYADARNHESLDAEKDMFKQKIEDKDVKQWIIDQVKTLCDRYITIENKFDELGLTLSESDNNEIEQTTKTVWAQTGALYEQNSVSESTYKLIATNQKKERMIFDKYYGTGGIEEIPNDKLLVHFKENFASINRFGMAIAQPTDGELSDEDKLENEEVKKKADEYVKLFNEGKKTFNELFDMYSHERNEDEHDPENAEDKIRDDEESRYPIKKDSTSPSEKVVKAIFEEMKPDGTAKVIADDNAYYFVVRYDVTKKESDFEEMKQAVLADIKGDDFTTMVDGWTAEQKGTANTAAINRYNPKNVNFEMKTEA